MELETIRECQTTDDLPTSTIPTVIPPDYQNVLFTDTSEYLNQNIDDDIPSTTAPSPPRHFATVRRISDPTPLVSRIPHLAYLANLNGLEMVIKNSKKC